MNSKVTFYSHRAGRRIALLGGTPKVIVLAAVTFGLSSILVTSDPAVAADTRFKACRHSNDAAKHTVASAIPQARMAADDPHCSSAQNSSLSFLGELTERAPAILHHLEITKMEMENSQDFDRALQQNVFQHLDEAIAKYDRWSSCETPCQLNSETVETTGRQYEHLRLELSLMQPDDPALQARQSPKSWIASRPRHPFAAAASLPLSTPEERDQARGEFLRRLSEKKISTTLGETREEVTRIDKAMIDIRSEAHRNYLTLISDNPLLLFLNPDSRTSSKASETKITPPQIRDASKKLADEIRSEKARLLELPMADRLEALIDYAPLAERILKQNPQFCNTAEKLAETAETRRSRRQMALVAGQVAIGIASTVMCGTIVSCGLAAAGLSAVDFGVASRDASLAFKEGVSQSATSRDGESLMTKADSAAGAQALSLVFGAPIALKSSFDLVRKGSALATAKRSSPQTSGTLTEVVGRQAATKPVGTTSLNTLHSIVYQDLLKNHEGREREILEIVIERLQRRKMDPDQISKLLKERVRQCSK